MHRIVSLCQLALHSSEVLQSVHARDILLNRYFLCIFKVTFNVLITGRTNYFYNIDVKTVKTSNVTLKISWKKLKISIFNIIASYIDGQLISFLSIRIFEYEFVS